MSQRKSLFLWLQEVGYNELIREIDKEILIQFPVRARPQIQAVSEKALGNLRRSFLDLDSGIELFLRFSSELPVPPSPDILALLVARLSMALSLRRPVGADDGASFSGEDVEVRSSLMD